MLSSQLGGGGRTHGAVYRPLSHPQQPRADEVPGLCRAKAKRRQRGRHKQPAVITHTDSPAVLMRGGGDILWL